MIIDSVDNMYIISQVSYASVKIFNNKIIIFGKQDPDLNEEQCLAYCRLAPKY